MDSLIRSIVIVAMALAGSAALSGCTSTQETFAGHDADHVWTAMVAAAREPDYSSAEDYTERWTVRENQVWVDEANRRVEIFRRIERDLYRPASKHLHEERQWRFQAVLEQRDPPTVSFTSRQVGVPAHAWDEAERYFDAVWQVLGGRPGHEESDQSAPSEPVTDEAASEANLPVFGQSYDLSF
jgi:hypothetical protein